MKRRGGERELKLSLKYNNYNIKVFTILEENLSY